jgi:hypothetical protein
VPQENNKSLLVVLVIEEVEKEDVFVVEGI